MTGPQLSAAAVVLRGLEPDDAEAVAAYASSPGFFDHIEVPDALRRAYTLSDAQAFIAQAARDAADWPTWAIEVAGRLVGTIRIRAAAWGGVQEIGFGLAPSARGQGHATAAVRAVMVWCAAEGRPLPWARCRAGNHASARVLERTGFTCTDRGDWQHWAPPVVA